MREVRAKSQLVSGVDCRIIVAAIVFGSDVLLLLLLRVQWSTGALRQLPYLFFELESPAFSDHVFASDLFEELVQT